MFIRLVVCMLLTIVLLDSCSGNPVTNSGTEPLDDTTHNIALGEIITEINTSRAPEGIDAGIYDELKAELIRVLSAEASKRSSIPPTGELNEVTDLALTGDDAEGWRLEWSYLNTGDYDLNSEVNISDITPVGLYFGAIAGDVDWIDASCADGDSNGEVNISDITPIGQNYQAVIGGFNIYGAASASGPWELVGSISCPAAPADGTFLVTYDLAAKDHGSYRVVPYDGESLEGQESWPCGHMGEPAEVTLGMDTVVATQTIGASGGTITAAGGSPIDGVSMTFPPGALLEDTVVSLGYNDGTADLPLGELGLPILSIEAGDVYEFAGPAQITVPFAGDQDTFPLALYIYDDGRLDGMQALDVDYDADTFTFETFHTTRIAFVFGDQFYDDYVLAIWLGFYGTDNGFWVKNKRTQYTDGNCLGMSVFAKWFFETKMEYLYKSYRELVSWDPPKHCQEIIATRAQLAVHRYYKDYAPAIIGRGYVASDKYNFNAIFNMFVITKQPQVVILDSPAGQHAVLVHAVMFFADYPDRAWLRTYDPNVPGKSQLIKYNPQTQQFQPYTSGSTTYNKIIHFGTGTIRYAESFDDILADANQSFNGSADATIDVQSHTDGDSVTTLLADISGIVHSGAALVEKCSIRNGNDVIEVDLGVNGEFRVDVPMHEGENFLSFHTQGYNEDNRLVTVHNNLLTSGFTLIGDFPPAEITINSHGDGDKVFTRDVELAGTITSGEVQVDQVHVFTNGNGPFIAEVNEAGQFNVGLPLVWGENRLEFNLYGLAGAEQYVNVPHNRTTPFILNAKFDGNAITAVMHMDHRLDDSSCMNLYVIDPTGDCSWFMYPLTDDGAYLQTGFDDDHSPPCFFQEYRLEYSDTVRWGQDYTVRVHWGKTASPGPTEPPALYEVLITINEGYETQDVIYRTGSISGPPDNWNDECDATGPDWVDIAVVSPTQP